MPPLVVRTRMMVQGAGGAAGGMTQYSGFINCFQVTAAPPWPPPWAAAPPRLPSHILTLVDQNAHAPPDPIPVAWGRWLLVLGAAVGVAVGVWLRFCCSDDVQERRDTSVLQGWGGECALHAGRAWAVHGRCVTRSRGYGSRSESRHRKNLLTPPPAHAGHGLSQQVIGKGTGWQDFMSGTAAQLLASFIYVPRESCAPEHLGGGGGGSLPILVPLCNFCWLSRQIQPTKKHRSVASRGYRGGTVCDRWAVGQPVRQGQFKPGDPPHHLAVRGDGRCAATRHATRHGICMAGPGPPFATTSRDSCFWRPARYVPSILAPSGCLDSIQRAVLPAARVHPTAGGCAGNQSEPGALPSPITSGPMNLPPQTC